MAIVVTFPPAGGLVGPGYFVGSSGATGPTALHDLCRVLVETSTGGTLCDGNAFYQGGTVGQVTLGVSETSVTSLLAVISAVTPGAAAQLRVQHFNASGGFIEESVTTGFTWDPSGGLWALMARMLRTGLTADLTEVLDAVRKTFP
jgi:hypothetical protein